jgi:replication-associated recombination protein RarA
MAYEIGYKRPPKSGQFAKGKSGNPKGRPKGSNNFITILEKELGQSISVNENGKKKTITRLQAMVKRVVAGALQGDQKSLLTLIEIMRRTGRFEQTEAESLLPDNYESILDSYVQKRQQTGVKKSKPT